MRAPTMPANFGSRRDFFCSSAATAAALVAGCGGDAELAVETDGENADRSQSPHSPTAKPIRNDWPALFGPFRNATTNEDQLLDTFPQSGPKLLWSHEVGEGYSSPVIRNGQLLLHYRVDDHERVELLNAVTGEPLWRREFPTRFVCQFEMYSSGPYSTPILGEDRLVVISAEGHVRCLRSTDGESLWTRDLKAEFQAPEPLFAFGATPLLDQGKLFLGTGGESENGGVAAFDWQTGETIWQATDHAASYATPVVASVGERRFLLVTTFEGLVCLEPDSGRVHWQIPFRPKSPDTINATSPAVHEDLILMVTGPGPGAMCVRLREDGSYKQVWRDRRALDSQFNTLIHLGEHVFGFTSSRQGGAQLRCLNFEDGKVRWEWSSPLERGMGLAADGRLILWGEKGHLAMLEANPKKAIPLCITDEPLLSAPCYSSPALAGGRLYLRNQKKLLCLQMSAALDAS